MTLCDIGVHNVLISIHFRLLPSVRFRIFGILIIKKNKKTKTVPHLCSSDIPDVHWATKSIAITHYVISPQTMSWNNMLDSGVASPWHQNWQNPSTWQLRSVGINIYRCLFMSVVIKCLWRCHVVESNEKSCDTFTWHQHWQRINVRTESCLNKCL